MFVKIAAVGKLRLLNKKRKRKRFPKILLCLFVELSFEPRRGIIVLG
jgi:hypothetical protein